VVRGPQDTQLTTCAIVTCAASSDIAQLHHRMPVVLEPDTIGLWLGEEGHGAATLMRALPQGSLSWHRVTTEVNKARGDEARFLDPLPN
ncbi:MAG: SOS response-associated peptidase family protein, partial [Pseudomonadota bacterium]